MSKDNDFKTEPHFIAYLDILGYKDKIKNGEFKFVKVISEAIQKAEYLSSLLGEFTNSEIKIKAFTDNILICSKTNWLSLMKIVGYIQSYLVERNCFIRGALCYSNLYFDDKFLFGKGIVMAHEIESTIAISPRVLVHSTYISNARKSDENNYFKNFILVDSDGYKYLDYLFASNALVEADDAWSSTCYLGSNGICEEMLKKHKSSITKQIKNCEERYLPKNIMSKFLWSKGYHNYFCDNHGLLDYKIN